jgi:RNA polymerase sigma-70 factor (ECF subfamily)
MRRGVQIEPTLAFVERVSASEEQLEDVDTGRLVTRIQAGDSDLFAELYRRYFDRVYGYLLVMLTDQREAEDAAQHVFVSALENLSAYELRGQPFRAWLFTIARNRAIDQLRGRNRIEPVDPHEMRERRSNETSQTNGDDPGALDWVTDQDLVLFIERLPLAQRQVLMLRYGGDLSVAQIAGILGRSEADVRMLQSRAHRFLRERLGAVRRRSRERGSVRMRRWPREATVLRSRRWALHV